jgi:hypothetical protein
MGGGATTKTEIGTAKDSRLVIANHLDQPNHLANQQQVLGFAVPFCSDKMLDQNQFAEPNQHVLTFLHPKLACTLQGWSCW